MKRFLFLLVLILLCSFTYELLAQCPMCKTSLEQARKGGTQVGSTLNHGILYLLALPYSIASIFGIVWWRSTKQKRKGKSF